jgi:hypothetical protein
MPSQTARTFSRRTVECQDASGCSPDFERADRIGEYWGHPETRTFGELLIDLEEDKALKAVIWGLLRETERE